MWWAEAAYPLITLISALFIHRCQIPLMHKNSLFLRNVFLFVSLFFFSSYTKSFVFTKLTQATTSHLELCCIKLWHQPRSNCFQTRQGQSFLSIFHFLAQVSDAQYPTNADNEKRRMMSLRQSIQRQNLVTKFPGSYHFPLSFLLLSFPLICLLSILFFCSSDCGQVQHLWESTW